ncbi:MAG: ester cyclase [Chlamydiales bacterium]|nr:ester cyclase [Chlamydiales bacterium]
MKKTLKSMLFSSIMALGQAQASIAGTSLEATDQNIKLVQRLLAYGDEQVVAHHEEFFCDKVIIHCNRAPQGEEIDVSVVKKYDMDRVAALLAQNYEILDAFAFEDKIVLFMRVHATHVGEFEGVEATNKYCNVSMLFMYRFRDGKICEVWSSWDKLEILKQLGDVHVTPKS